LAKEPISKSSRTFACAEATPVCASLYCWATDACVVTIEFVVICLTPAAFRTSACSASVSVASTASMMLRREVTLPPASETAFAAASALDASTM
jgi:hypothetical protein